jgi:hypothetical protein
MARRHKLGLFEDLLDITSKAPWWFGLILAIVTYFVLHHFSTAEIPRPSSAKGIVDIASGQIFKTLATIGQYFLPFVFLLGAAASAISGPKRNPHNCKISCISESHDWESTPPSQAQEGVDLYEIHSRPAWYIVQSHLPPVGILIS